MKKILVLSLIIVAFVLAGCKTGGTKADDSKPVAKKEKKTEEKSKTKSGKGTIYVIVDRNIKSDQRADKAKAQKQIGDWMEKDLLKVLKKRVGFDAKAIKSASEFKQGKDNYLLNVTIVKYNPGSAAARAWVGFGAGAASMDISYTLKSSQGKKVLSNSDGVGSGASWQRVARKLNENMAREVKLKVY